MQIQHKRLKLALVLAGLSRGELCSQVGISRQFMINVTDHHNPKQKRKITEKRLEHISMILKVPGNWLCGEEGDIDDIITDKVLEEFGLFYPFKWNN